MALIKGCILLFLRGFGGLHRPSLRTFQHVDQLLAQLPVLDRDKGPHDAQAFLGRGAMIAAIRGDFAALPGSFPALLRRKRQDVAGRYPDVVVHGHVSSADARQIVTRLSYWAQPEIHASGTT